MLFDIFEILICYDISVFWYLKGCFRYIILFFLLFLSSFVSQKYNTPQIISENVILFFYFFCNLLTIKLLFFQKV